MANTLTMKRLLGFKDFFPNEIPKSKEYYANKIGRDLIEKFCCYFLSYFRHNAVPPIDHLLKKWFTFDDFTFRYFQSPSYFAIEAEYRRIENHHKNENHALLSVESLLNMYLWVYDKKDISNEIENPDASITMSLFEFYLVFNEDVLQAYAKATESVKPFGEKRKLQRLLFTVSFPQCDLINIDYAQLMLTQIYKAGKLLQFIEKVQEYNCLLTQLLGDFVCSSKEEFFKAIIGAVLKPLNTKYPAWSTLSLENSLNREKASLILDKLSIESEEGAIEQNDYLLLRNKPFHKTNNGEYRAIFDLFLIKKIYNGLVFKLNTYDKKFFGKVREEFSEGVLVYDTIKEVLKLKNARIITGNEFKAKPISLKREPDLYARVHNDILLFESKDFFMKGECKLSYDFAIIENNLKTNGESEKEDRFKKATSQLNKNIERCILKTMPLDNEYDLEKVRIFPIIIVHDSLYSSAALNYWIHYWLQDEIKILMEDVKFKAFDFSRIKHLTIIEIDTLLIYQNHFAENRFDLITVIEMYHNFVQFGIEDTLRTQKEIEEHAQKSALPFSEFVRLLAFQLGLELDFKFVEEIFGKFKIY